MSTDDYIVQNTYSYSRKSYNKDVNSHVDVFTGIRGVEIPDDATVSGYPGCSCDLDSKGVMATILHKKCPIIALAQQQLQRVTDETDRIFGYNNRCCRSTYDFLLLCKDVAFGENKNLYALLFTVVSFIIGVIFGAASCGTHLRKFNSPLLACIDNFFASDISDNSDVYHAIF